jgi:hypothetical protein
MDHRENYRTRLPLSVGDRKPVFSLSERPEIRIFPLFLLALIHTVHIPEIGRNAALGTKGNLFLSFGNCEDP